MRPGYKQTEVGVIPEDWDVKRLREDVTLLSGHHVLAQFCNSERGVPYLTGPADFQNGVINHTKFTTRPGSVCNAGDILITVKGSGVGTIVIADSDYCISRQLMAIRLGEWDGVFIFYSLVNSSRTATAASTGLIPGLSRDDILDLRLPVPRDPHEQTAVAKALADVDAEVVGLERLIAKKRDLKQAAMSQLLTGQTRLPGFSRAWAQKRLGEVGEIRSGGTPSTSQMEYWDGEIPWCTPTDITALLGEKYLSRTNRSITEAGLKASPAEILPERSLIMTSRATIGECAINLIPMTTNQGFKNIIPFEGYDVEFLYYLMTMQKSALIALCGGSTFLEIGKKQLLEFKIRVPCDSDEQTAIAAVLSDMDAELTALQAQLDKTRLIKQAMMQDLLTGRIRLPF